MLTPQCGISHRKPETGVVSRGDVRDGAVRLCGFDARPCGRSEVRKNGAAAWRLLQNAERPEPIATRFLPRVVGGLGGVEVCALVGLSAPSSLPTHIRGA